MSSRTIVRAFHGALLGLLAFSGVAAANGRTAATATVLEDPSDPQHLVAGVTFGMLVSADGGATWRWTCEENVGYSGVFDPVYAVTPAGTLLATTYDGLRVSRDGGCSFGIAVDLAGKWAVDLAVEGDGGIWVVTSSTGSDPSVFVSRDDASTFASAGLGVLRAAWRSVRVAPSDPERVFVSGYLIPENGAMAPTPLLFRREPDGGWTEIPFVAPNAREVIVLAVDPLDADVVFARVGGETSDRLFRSIDGGIAWTEVLGTLGPITGLALPTADRPGVVVTKAGAGYRSDDGITWTPTPDAPHGLCLTRRADGTLIACGDNWNEERAALVRWADVDDETTLEAMLRFSDIEGELDCATVPDGIHEDVCAPMWPSIMTGLGMVYDGAPGDAARPHDGGGTPDGGGGGGCGCGVALGLMGLVGFRTRRPTPRRPPAPRA